jgi:RNA polymerase sigma-70 factor (ECF subfamily)
LLKRKATSSLADAAESVVAGNGAEVEERMSNREEVEQLISQLATPEAEVVRMYHLEGKTYREISQSVGMAENTIGPTLSRARAKMRRAGAEAGM